MGNVSFSIPADLATTLVRSFDLQTAVETGTNEGGTARLLSTLVPEVWTIELSERLSREARERHRDVGSINFITGDSAQVLPELAPKVDRPALFWLDAHWCGTEATAGEAAQCPLLEELAAVDSAPAAAASCVLIDDAHVFLGGAPRGYRRSDFPSFIEVADALRARHDRFVTVLQDVIIAVPPHGRAVVEDYWQRQVEGAQQRARNSTWGRVKRAAESALPAGTYTRLRDVRNALR